MTYKEWLELPFAEQMAVAAKRFETWAEEWSKRAAAEKAKAPPGTFHERLNYELAKHDEDIN